MTTQDPLRGTGRTTNLILHYANACIQSPGVWIVMFDHTDKKIMHTYIAKKVSDILNSLYVDHQLDSNSVRVAPRK